MYICIAGKNKCSINAIKILTKYKINKKNIYILLSSGGADKKMFLYKMVTILNKITNINKTKNKKDELDNLSNNNDLKLF